MNNQLPLDSRAADARVDEVSRALQHQPLLGAGQLAGLVGLSRSRLREVFKKETGVCMSLSRLVMVVVVMVMKSRQETYL
jgi:hypothetical protein